MAQIDPHTFSPETWQALRQETSRHLNSFMMCALLAIGVVGTLGLLPSVAVSGSTMGISAGLFLSSIYGGTRPKVPKKLIEKVENSESRLEDRYLKIAFDSILAVALIAISSLSLRGFFPSSLVSWATVTPLTLWGMLACCKYVCRFSCNVNKGAKP